MDIFKLPAMDEDEKDDLVREQLICRVAFKGDEYPYIAPFQYVCIGGSLYFHFTKYGRKRKFAGENSKVCVEIEKYSPDMSDYKFVVLRGTLKVVTDPAERTEAIKRLAEEGKKKLSTKFLAAHGLKADENWSSLSPDRPFVIVKLEKVIEKMGLKSP
jgi:nitroimidazol reductase NimA-like FMN-containing flavoprotein (pyridoxamine 5'-phosphate oxidase superfamily)